MTENPYAVDSDQIVTLSDNVALHAELRTLYRSCTNCEEYHDGICGYFHEEVTQNLRSCGRWKNTCTALLQPCRTWPIEIHLDRETYELTLEEAKKLSETLMWCVRAVESGANEPNPMRFFETKEEEKE